MTTVQTRVNEIYEIEHFSIVVMRDGAPVNARENGVITPYRFARAAKHSMTVADWRRRFEQDNPGYTCDVLNEDGTIAEGQTTLRTVRETYEE